MNITVLPKILLHLLTAFLLFLMMQPVFVWGTNLFYIRFLLLLLFMTSFRFPTSSDLISFFLFVIALAIVPITHHQNILGLTATLMYAFIPFSKQEFVRSVYRYFKLILAVITGISLIFWVMVVLLNINLPYSIVAPLNSLKDYNYLSYKFLVLPAGIESLLGLISRFCCIFDEPGVVGTYSLIILFIEDFRFKRWDNLIFLIAGLASFSLFFYIGLALFLAAKVFLTPSLKKYRLYVALVEVAFIIFLFSNPFLNEMIGYRLELNNSSKVIVGNNRSSESFDDYIDSIRWSNKYLWGDTQDVIDEFSSNAGLNNAILRYGFVFVVLFFVFFIFFAKSKLPKARDWILFALLLFLTLYQRPGFLNVSYLFLFTSAIYVPLNSQNKESQPS